MTSPAGASDDLPAEVGQVLDLLPEAHLVVDLAGVVRYVSAAAQGWLVSSPALDRPLAEQLADPGTSSDLLARCGRSAAFRPTTLTLADGTRLRCDGARLPAHPLLVLRLRPQQQALNPFARINERVEAENLRELSRRLDASVRDLREANVRLAAANEEVAQYARAVAHDIRTPLFTLQGFARLLEDDGHVDEEGAEYVELIVGSTERLRRITDGLLAVANLDPDTATEAETDTAAALGEVLTDLRGELAAADVEVRAGQLHTVAVDPSALRRVLQNLLVNCVRHGRVPGRPLHVDVSSRRTDGEVEVAVRDDGRGIDPADRERVFELFHRGDVAEQAAGTGIGLAACRKIVGAWGGTITCEAPDGPGVRFVFTAPAAG